MTTTAEYGYVTDFDYNTITGKVKLPGRSVSFNATCWDSGPPGRPPRKGEGVQVVFNDEGELLSVRSVPA